MSEGFKAGEKVWHTQDLSSEGIVMVDQGDTTDVVVRWDGEVVDTAVRAGWLTREVPDDAEHDMSDLDDEEYDMSGFGEANEPEPEEETVIGMVRGLIRDEGSKVSIQKAHFDGFVAWVEEIEQPAFAGSRSDLLAWLAEVL